MDTRLASRSRLESRSWFAVVLAYQACERQYARLLAGFDLTIAQFEVLGAIDELGDRATPALIAQRLLVTKGNISALLKRLGDSDLIRTTPNPDDGRSQLCRLGPGVAATLAVARQASAAFISEQLAPFSDSQLTATESQMTRMRQHLEGIDTERLVAKAREAGDEHAR